MAIKSAGTMIMNIIIGIINDWRFFNRNVRRIELGVFSKGESGF